MNTLIRVAAVLLFAVPYGVPAEALPDFRELVKQNDEAVVNISTKSSSGGDGDAEKSRPGMPPIPEDSPLREFFRHFFGDEEFGGDGPRPRIPQSSLGSGFIISKDGYVVSNLHVVRGADEVIVRLSDRREFVATLIGGDERSDIAILKIDTKESLPVVELGDSAKLEPGEWVLAIGSPFGFEHSVTQGIVSAVGRSLPNENYVPFIQTDVAINPGNSGGPLFNLDGQVVGVNSQIFSRTGGFMGLSFAIPINVVLDVYGQILEHGKVKRGWLGVLIQDIDQQLAESFDMKRPQGALVSRVLDDSPAKSAGFEVGDVILKFNKKPIVRSSDLPPLVGRTMVGDRVPVEILRNSKRTTLQVKIGELPAEEEIALSAAEPEAPEGEYKDPRLKITVTDVPEDRRESLDIDSGGVLVTDVGGGPAFDAGVRKGDVLVQVDNTRIESVEQFRGVMGDMKGGRAVAVLLQRRGGPLFMAMKVPER